MFQHGKVANYRYSPVPQRAEVAAALADLSMAVTDNPLLGRCSYGGRLDMILLLIRGPIPLVYAPCERNNCLMFVNTGLRRTSA